MELVILDEIAISQKDWPFVLQNFEVAEVLRNSQSLANQLQTNLAMKDFRSGCSIEPVFGQVLNTGSHSREEPFWRCHNDIERSGVSTLLDMPIGVGIRLDSKLQGFCSFIRNASGLVIVQFQGAGRTENEIRKAPKLNLPSGKRIGIERVGIIDAEQVPWNKITCPLDA